MKGVLGKVLKVDLSNGTIQTETLPDRVYEYFLGGAGLAVYYMWKECPAGTTAFNPANRLIFASGPMTGLKQTAGAAKWTAGTISPSINMNADTAATASWGIEMKETNYDPIVIYDRSPKPVYIVVDDRKAKKSEIIKGTGRFEENEGTANIGVMYLPVEKGEAGARGYGDGTITYTLPPK